MMKNAAMCMAALFVFASAAKADGIRVYDNGRANGVDGNEFTQWLQTEDFRLDVDATVNGASVDWFDFQNTAWSGIVEWYIFADNSGNPGSVLASGATVSVTTTDLGTGNGWQNWNSQWKFGLGVDLTAGTPYHFGVHFSNDYADREERYWASTNGNGTNTGIESDGGTMDNWINNGTEHAFQLQGVPEPASIALLGLGASALLRRRRN